MKPLLLARTFREEECMDLSNKPSVDHRVVVDVVRRTTTTHGGWVTSARQIAAAVGHFVGCDRIPLARVYGPIRAAAEALVPSLDAKILVSSAHL